MRIQSYSDASINFIPDALDEIKYFSIKEEVSTNISGIKLVIGKNKGRFNIVLMQGNASLAAVQLIHRFERTSNGQMICEPHSYTRKQYRGNGYVEQIYRWILDNNIVLRSADHQTTASHNLWKKLGHTYKLKFFDNNSQTYKSEKSIYHPDVLMELRKH